MEKAEVKENKMEITIKLKPSEVKRLYLACRYMVHRYKMLANRYDGNISTAYDIVANSFDEISHKLLMISERV